MKNILILALFFSSFVSYASEKHHHNIKANFPKHQHNPYCIFDVIPLNSPVKDSFARFKIVIPTGYDLDEVSYHVRNAGRLFEKNKIHQRIKLITGSEGKELKISVSGLPSGFYQLFVKVKDKKNKEHHFRTKFKDHAMFVVDSSLQVPAPNPKLNDKTIAGKKYLDNLTCLSSIVGLDKRSQLRRELNAKLLNTKDRLYANLKTNANFSGQV